LAFQIGVNRLRITGLNKAAAVVVTGLGLSLKTTKLLLFFSKR